MYINFTFLLKITNIFNYILHVKYFYLKIIILTNWHKVNWPKSLIYHLNLFYIFDVKSYLQDLARLAINAIFCSS